MDDAFVARKKAEMKRAKRKEGLVALALLSPYIIIFVVFTLIPMILGIALSFMRYNPYDSSINEFYGFRNFANIFNFSLPISKEFWQSFSTMLTFDLVTVPIMIVIPLALAYLINLHPPGYKIFRAVIYLPSVVSVTIVGVIFGNIFKGNSDGLLNAWLGKSIDWLGGKPWQGDTLRWLVMLIATIWWQTGSNFVIFSGALRNVPKSLFEACEMDGGNRLKKIWYVVFPNIKSSVNICVFNTLLGFLYLYGQPLVLNTTENADILVSPMMFIQHYLMNGIAFARQTGFMCACTLIFGLITMALSILQRKVMAERRPKAVHTSACIRYLQMSGKETKSASEDINA